MGKLRHTLLTCSHSQLASSGARIWNKVVWFQNLCCEPLLYVASSSVIQPTLLSTYHELTLC